jgi:HEAT repeat protein
MKSIRFPDRAVQACVEAMANGRVSPRHVKDVIKYPDVDVTPIEPFLFHEDDYVRRFAVEIIGKRGNKEKLIDALAKETNRQILLLILKILGKEGTQLEKAVAILEHTDPVIRCEAIETYRKSGKADCLVSLLFDDDDSLVEKIKGYIKNEQTN